MTRSRRPELRTHRNEIRRADVTVLDGLPVTTLARSWWALGAVLRLADLVAAGDCALRLGVTIDALDEQRRLWRGRRGNRTVAAALPLLDQRSRSRPETHLRVIVRLGGLDCFDVNTPISNSDGEWLAEPDLSCEQARVALEYQGSDHAELSRMRRDITRATDLRRAGWMLLNYGPAEVFGRPEQIAPELRHLVQRRAPQVRLKRPVSNRLH
ncbi:DUF559 domain-containing protein [Jatrophihabitans telluris]|uniref:DUF559 domain-containing protein n=1 Tax=Jatrophihabitans telluris TaxID=2038343 RepID=A0ABY4R586_9ACTN|nr:DUF559 domain-containing protein [Jatrophihabitans telluris]UQX89949.1 DUF559 domain-containing protein [Jatrophihabitans telluris]